MKTNFKDFRNEWPKIKKQLVQFSQEAVTLAKKGEEEIVRFSHKGKKHFDATALGLKKEHLYLQIGKEYIKAKCPGAKPAKLKKLLEEFRGIEKEERRLQKSLHGS